MNTKNDNDLINLKLENNNKDLNENIFSKSSKIIKINNTSPG